MTRCTTWQLYVHLLMIHTVYTVITCMGAMHGCQRQGWPNQYYWLDHATRLWP